MATIIDISNKIKNEQKFIKLGDKNYKVDDSKNTVIRALDLINKEDGVSSQDKALELLLGKTAHKEIEAMNLNLEDYKVVFIAVMACINGDTYEKTEERFRGETNES